jgi:hypothetical protein
VYKGHFSTTPFKIEDRIHSYFICVLFSTCVSQTCFPLVSLFTPWPAAPPPQLSPHPPNPGFRCPFRIRTLALRCPLRTLVCVLALSPGYRSSGHHNSAFVCVVCACDIIDARRSTTEMLASSQQPITGLPVWPGDLLCWNTALPLASMVS